MTSGSEKPSPDAARPQADIGYEDTQATPDDAEVDTGAEHTWTVGPTGTGEAPRPASRAPRPGAVFGEYELIRELGRGGFGAVFLARDIRLGRRVAAKFLAAKNPRVGERFLTEARATARCKHENIVTIHDLGRQHGHSYMILELVEGQTLRAWWRRQWGGEDGRVSASVAVEMMIKVVRALEHAHGLGIVHRDLKPENVMLSESGALKVLDFGIAKILDVPDRGQRPGDGEDPAIGPGMQTHTGSLMGTMPYMSPEQWRGRGIDERTDIWAVGVMLWELLTGEHPLAPLSRGRLETVGDLDVAMPSLVEVRPEFGDLAALVDRCLRKDPDQRIPSASALLDRLEALLPGRGAAHAAIDTSPFAGLAALQEADAGRFFGREDDIASVTARLRHQPLVAIVGPSGAGKSSLVRAGVIPALERADRSWYPFVARPGRRPLSALCELLARVSSTPGTEADLRERPGALGVALRERCRKEQRRGLLFVDQFEELYTLGASRAEREAFISCLEGVADDASSPLRLVLSLRADFLERVAENRSFMAAVTRGLMFLAPVGRAGLRAALCRPLEAVEHAFESPDMVDAMLDSLQAARTPLPLLQFTAAQLWAARDRDRRLLTAASYQRLGGVEGALATHADEVLASTSARERPLVRLIFTHLVTEERTRAVVGVDELRALVPGAAVVALEQVLQRLVEARLVLMENSPEEGATVEVSHESLIDRWPKIAQWLAEDQDDSQFRAGLRAAAREWHKHGRSEDLLWRGQAANDARRRLQTWRARASEDGRASDSGSLPGLGERDTDYLTAVIALAARARRRKRRLALAAFALVTAIAIVVSILSLQARRAAERAETQAALAQTESLQARNVTRLATARRYQDDPTLVLALVRELEPSAQPSEEWRPLARDALREGVAQAVLEHPEAVHHAEFSPDGTRLVTAGTDGIARVFRADGTGPPQLLQGHQKGLSQAVFSPDGRRIATGSSDHTGRIFDIDGASPPVVLTGHTALVAQVAFSPDGRAVVTGSVDGTARVWSVDGTSPPVVLEGHKGPVRAVAFSPDGTRVATASRDRTARVFTLDGSREPAVLAVDQNSVEQVAFNEDGTRVLTGSMFGTIRLWNALGDGAHTMVHRHTLTIMDSSFSPDRQRILGASFDGLLWVWDAHAPAAPLISFRHPGPLLAAAFSPDGTRIVTTSFEDHVVRIWNADASGSPLVLRGHQDHVIAARFSPDGERIVTASTDRTVRIWQTRRTTRPIVLEGHTDLVHTARFSRDGSRIVTASRDHTARIWNADGSDQPTRATGHGTDVVDARFSPDGARLVTVSKDRTMRIWDARTGAERWVSDSHDTGFGAVRYNLDGTRIATASGDPIARVWNADGTGSPVLLGGHQMSVTAVAFSPDGTRLATASVDATARVWNADGSGRPVVLRGHETYVLAVGFSPDGRRLVTASADATARVWNADGTGSPIVLRGHDGPVQSAQFGPDGTDVLTGGADGTWRIWRARGGDATRVVPTSRAWVKVESSPDGRHVVGVSDDWVARVWRIDGPDEPLELRGHQGWVRSAAFSPDGTRIVTASADRTARIWRIEDGAPLLVLGGIGSEGTDGVVPPMRHWTALRSATFHPDGTRVAVTSGDRATRLWDLQEDSAVVVFKGASSMASFNGDGTRLALALFNGDVRLQNANDSGEAQVLRGHEGPVTTVVFSPDGTRLLSVSSDGSARIWPVTGQGEPVILRDDRSSPVGAAWSPDGTRVVTAGKDRRMRIWRADGTGTATVLEGHDDVILAAAWSPDGTRVASLSFDGTNRIWNADGSGEPTVLRFADSLPPQSTIGSVGFSRDGTRLLTTTGGATAWIWTDLERFSGIDDERLWSATDYCPSVERRMALLDVPEYIAERDLRRCRARLRERTNAR